MSVSRLNLQFVCCQGIHKLKLSRTCILHEESIVLLIKTTDGQTRGTHFNVRLPRPRRVLRRFEEDDSAWPVA